MFKNISIFTITANEPSAEPMQEFVPCGPTQALSYGWVPPRGVAHGPLAESINEQMIAKLLIESKAVPDSVVRSKLDERVKQIEDSTGRKPGKKERKELKEEINQELLVVAFPKQTVWIDPKAGLMVVDSVSSRVLDIVVTEVVKMTPSAQVAPLMTTTAAGTAMSSWLQDDGSSHGFDIGRNLTLTAFDESGSTVTYSKHPLDIEEVRDHLQAGKAATALGLGWKDRVSFVLTNELQLRKVAIDPDCFTPGPGADDFDADVAISTGELSGVIANLIESLDGRWTLQQGEHAA